MSVTKSSGEIRKTDAFDLFGGEICMWIDQDILMLKAGDIKSNDPAELTKGMAIELVAALEQMIKKLYD